MPSSSWTTFIILHPWLLTAEMSLLTANFLQALQSRQAPHCLAGASKPLFQSLFRTSELPGCVEIVPLRPLRPDEAQEMLEGLCRRFDVTLASDLSSFVVEQLHCNPFYIRSIVQTARRESKDLGSARQFANLYDSEVIEGGLSLYFSSLLHSTSLTAVERIKALEFLHYCANAPLEFAALHYLKGRELSEGVDFEAILNALASLGLIDYSFGVVSALHDPVLRDWVNWNFSHKVDGAELARVRFDLASGLLRRAGQTRQSHPQTHILKTLQATFEGMNCQSVPLAWFRYAEQLRPEAAGSEKARASREEEVVLPEVLSVSVPGNLAPTGSELPIDVVLARGFDQGIYTDETETAWLAGSVAGAAGLNEVQQFHRRCEAIKRQEGLKRTQFWLVAEEKFNQAAMSFADSQGLYTSNLEQLQMLAHEVLRPEDAVQEAEDREQLPDYAMTIPMSADSELVAVRAFEQIAEGLDFTEKAKGQVRMALMEACINIKEALAKRQRENSSGFQDCRRPLVDTPAA